MRKADLQEHSDCDDLAHPVYDLLLHVGAVPADCQAALHFKAALCGTSTRNLPWREKVKI